MIQDEDKDLYGELRIVKHEVDTNSERVKRLVDQLVANYNRDLDNYIDKVKGMLDRKEMDRLTDEEVEDITLRVPIYMYFGVQGLESLGVDMDTSKAIKATKYNELYTLIEGTIPDKKAEAENQVIVESLMQVCYERAYKKLKSKMDVAEHICQSARKILQKRISEIDISKRDKGYTREGEKVHNSNGRERIE